MTRLMGYIEFLIIIQKTVSNINTIPYYHQFNQAYLGAAIATVISYFIMSLMLYVWNKSLFNF